MTKSSSAIKWIPNEKPEVGQEVKLFKHKRVMKQICMTVEMLSLIGKIGIIEAINPDEVDEAGCTLVWVRVGEKLISWRVTSARKKKIIGI